ncbi:MAG TPA: response regulator [Chitinophagales bacterium]|nr:response regulator [Chitinophagales bacterium]
MRDKIFILLIEDDADDIHLLKAALESNGIPYTMKEIMSGDEVISYLKSCNELPHVIVLDLNLPKMHGKEVLKAIKEEDSLHKIPLMVLTTSNALEDKDFCLKLGANSFITKPTTQEEFNSIITTLVSLTSEKG